MHVHSGAGNVSLTQSFMIRTTPLICEGTLHTILKQAGVEADLLLVNK